MEAVIVTYNSADDLSSMLSSSKLQRCFSRILVVDNASTDDSREIAASVGLEVIARPENDGYGAAANIGIGLTHGEFVALLNPDIHLQNEDIVMQLKDHFAQREVGLVAPALQLPDGRLQDSAREVPIPLDLFRRRLSGRDLGRIDSTTPQDVPWVVGAFMIHESFNEPSAPSVDLTRGAGLLIASLSISLDSLGVGFALPGLGIPLLPMLITVSITTTIFTFVGMAFGNRIGDQHRDRNGDHAHQDQRQIAPVLALPDQRAQTRLRRHQFG